jgi:hypothetical protein
MSNVVIMTSTVLGIVILMIGATTEANAQVNSSSETFYIGFIDDATIFIL